MFKIEVKTEGAAFEGEEERVLEILRILSHIAERIDLGCMDGTVMDINGNKVGKWKLD